MHWGRRFSYPNRWLPAPMGGCAPAKPAKSLVIQDKGCRALGGCAPAKPVRSLVVAYSIGGCLPDAIGCVRGKRH